MRRPAQFIILFLLVCVCAAAHAQTPAASADPNFAAMEKAVTTGAFVKIGSVLVTQNGHTLYEHYFDGDAATLRDTRSATKSVTGILIGIAIDKHQIASVATPILSLLKQQPLENRDPRKARITIEDLLTMSTTLECDDWNDFSRGNEERMYTLEDWTQFFLDLPMRGWVRNPGDPQAPDHRFSYCTAGAFTLSPILAQATGMPADIYAQKNLFDPLGVKDAQWVYSPLGIPQTGGGLRLTTRDLLKIAELYRNGGVISTAAQPGLRIVSSAWVAASIAPHAHIPDQPADAENDYGYLWWLRSFAAKDGHSYPAFYMSGNGGNKVVVVPTLDASIVLTSNNYNAHGMHQQTDKLLIDYILPALATHAASH